MKNKVSGFSLLEMSVVVLISGMIMTAILNLIPVIYKTTKSAMDSKKMEIVENAFYAFVAKNKNPTTGIAKVQIKSEKPTPFGGIFSGHEAI